MLLYWLASLLISVRPWAYGVFCSVPGGAPCPPVRSAVSARQRPAAGATRTRAPPPSPPLPPHRILPSPPSLPLPPRPFRLVVSRRMFARGICMKDEGKTPEGGSRHGDTAGGILTSESPLICPFFFPGAALRVSATATTAPASPPAWWSAASFLARWATSLRLRSDSDFGVKGRAGAANFSHLSL